MKTKNLLNKKITQWLLLVAMLVGCSANAWASNEYNSRYIYIDCTGAPDPYKSSLRLAYYWKASCDEGDGSGSTDSFSSAATNIFYYDLNNFSTSYSYLRSFKTAQGSGWYDQACLTPSSSGHKNNCIKITNYGTQSWSTYVLTPTAVTLKVTSGASGGSGTSSDPYIVEPGASFTLSASGVTYSPSDPNMSTRYGFGTSASSTPTSTSSTSTQTASSSEETKQYYVSVRGYYNSTYSSSYKSTSVYVKTKTACTPTDYYLGGLLNAGEVKTHNDDWKLTQFTPDGGAGAEFGYRGVFYFNSTYGGNNSEFPIILNNCDNIYNPASNDTQLGFNTTGVDLSMGNDFGKKCETRNITLKDLYTFVFSKRTSDGKYRITFNYPRIAGTFNDWSPSNTGMSSDGDHLSSDESYRLRYYEREVDHNGEVKFKITNGGWKDNFGGSDWGYNDGYDASQSILSSGITVTGDGDNNVVINNNSGSKVTATIYFDKDQKIFIEATIPCTPPTAYEVSGTASICTGSNTNVTLAGSQSGYTYKLYKNGSATDTTKDGTGSALNFSVNTAGTYTIKGYVTGNESCTTDMSGSAEITIKNAVVTTSPELNNIHPYEVVTLTATNKEDVTWTITAVPSGVEVDKNAYFPEGNTGKTVKFKGALGNGYQITAAADGCNTEVDFNVILDSETCN